MTTRILGCAELYGRLRYVTNHAGLQRRTHPFAGMPAASAFDDHDALGLHGHVLQGLGATAEYLEEGGGAACYPAFGFRLTEKAARLARFSEEFEYSGTWGEAIRAAASLAHQIDDAEDDQVFGDVTLLAVARHIGRQYPPEMTPLPGWLPPDTPLFLDGYPATLLGHVAADLRVDAVTATCAREGRAVILFRSLGWRLTPRAEALADAIQNYEAKGLRWPDAIAAAARVDVTHFERHYWDR
ncbi:hypothetical protein [Amycolatopsis sp. NPDC051061]|uniref:hypothetical protein n=1 Tax=Amycolatopsis sp. NPDC051061 TaxID=3155042 RepID=UPI00343B7B30